MSAFGWLKRALFGAESLAKSGVNKGKDAGEHLFDVSKEKLDVIKDELSESVDAAKDKFDDLFDKVGDKANDGVSSVKNKVTDFGDKLQVDKVKEGGKKILEGGAILASEAGAKIEEATEKIVDVSDRAWEKISETSGSLYDKAKDKAEEIGDKIGDKMDDMFDKAETMKEQDAIEDAKHPTGIYEGKSHNEKLEETSLLDGTDDFFSKAAAFADGDYEKATEGKMTIEKVDLPDDVIDTRETKGFDDLDGDGDDIADDAIIVEEE